MAATRRHRGVLVIALLGLLAAGAPGTAAPAPRRAAYATLTADTTITWRGAAGIRLRTTGGSLPEDAMSLFVEGGTYAFVSMLVDPQPASCRLYTPWPHCYGFTLSRFPRSEQFAVNPRPGHMHRTSSSKPPNLIGRHLDVYLFTDGEATLQLRPRGYRGRAAFVAAGRIRGAAVKLPGSCDDLCRDTPVGTVAAGGIGIDYGSRPGHLITHAYTVTDHTPNPELPPNHPNSVRTCYYPGIEAPWASPDPRDHPYGCEMPTDRGARPANDAIDVYNSVWFGTAQWASWRVGDQVGKRYAGFSVARAWPGPGLSAGYAIWFNYGIR